MRKKLYLSLFSLMKLLENQYRIACKQSKSEGGGSVEVFDVDRHCHHMSSV